MTASDGKRRRTIDPLAAAVVSSKWRNRPVSWLGQGASAFAPREQRERPMDRRSTIALLLLAPLFGAAVVMFALGDGPGMQPVDEERVGNPPPSASPSPSPSPSPDASVMPTADTAGSTILVQDFDMLATGSDVPEWISTGNATLAVAAVPTAVDRSALLTAEESGIACLPLTGEVANLTAEFMVEPLQSDGVTVLTIELTGDSAVSLAVSAEGARLADASERIRLQAGTWYRWSASRDGESFHLALSDLAGAELGTAETEARNATAEMFCISTESPTRIYLDTLTVEGH